MFYLPVEQRFSTLQHVRITPGNSDLMGLGKGPCITGVLQGPWAILREKNQTVNESETLKKKIDYLYFIQHFKNCSK